MRDEKQYVYYINGKAISETRFMELMTAAIAAEWSEKNPLKKDAEPMDVMRHAFEGAIYGVKYFERIIEKGETVTLEELDFTAVECDGPTV